MVRPLAVTLMAAVLAVGAGGKPAPTPTVRYVPEYLFSLPFGAGDDQVGVWVTPNPAESEGPPEGPAGIVAGPDETIYVVDLVNRCVKRFDSHGKLLLRTPGELDNINAIAVEQSTGAVVVQCSANMGDLTKIAADGKTVWSIDLFALRRLVPKEYGRGFYGVSIGAEGTTCLSLWDRSDVLLTLDEHGKYLAIREGTRCMDDGRVLIVRRTGPLDNPVHQVAAADGSGRMVAAFSRLPMAAGPPWHPIGAPSPGEYVLDASGCVYVSELAFGMKNIALSPAVTRRGDAVVSRFTPQGVVLARIRVPGSPFLRWRKAAVAPRGDVYHVAFDADRMHVIRYRATPGLPGQCQHLWETMTIEDGGTRYVPLRVLAEWGGRDYAWDQDARQATLTCRGAARKPPIVVKESDPGVLFRHEGLWLTVAAAARIGFKVNTDAQKRIFYLEEFVPAKQAP